jgi:hypothetical protein
VQLLPAQSHKQPAHNSREQLKKFNSYKRIDNVVAIGRAQLHQADYAEEGALRVMLQVDCDYSAGA